MEDFCELHEFKKISKSSSSTSSSSTSSSSTKKYSFKNQKRIEFQNPTILFLFNLKTQPIFYSSSASSSSLKFNNNDINNLQFSSSIQSIFNELKENWKVLKQEIESRIFHENNLNQFRNADDWLLNDVEKGNWNVFSLISQGILIENNLNQLPTLNEMLFRNNSEVGLKDLKSDNYCCFGNVFISLLGEKTQIEPHCGPTNARLRVHLALNCPGKVKRKQK